MSSWKAVVGVLAGSVALMLAIGWLLSAAKPSDRQVAPPQQTVRLASIVCDPGAGRPRADLTLLNEGDRPIRFAQAFVRFGTSVHGGYLTPSTLPPGSRANVTIYASHGADSDCHLDAVQDRDGKAIFVAR